MPVPPIRVSRRMVKRHNMPWLLELAVIESLEKRTLLSGASFAAQHTFPDGTAPKAIAAADFNNDVITDLVTVNTQENDLTVLLGNGDGTFRFDTTISLGMGAYPQGVAIGDFNGDGKMDIATTSGNDLCIILGNGNGTFQTPQTTMGADDPMGLAAGDLRDNGSLSIVTANYSGDDLSLFNSNSGMFNSVGSITVGTNPQLQSVAIADLNGDGKPDIAVTEYANSNVGILLNNGNGLSFQNVESISVANGQKAIAIGDLNGDGKADLVVSDYKYDQVSVLLGNGNGTFLSPLTFHVGNGPEAVALADLTSDGKLDIITTNHQGNISVLIGNGDGTFQSAQTFAVGNHPYSIAVGDFNHDGKPDVAVTNATDGNVSVLLSNLPHINSVSFNAPATAAAGNEPHSILTADLTNNGIQDIVVANSNSDSLSIFMGNGNGTFAAPTTIAAGNDPLQVISADVNNDGIPDLIVADKGVTFEGGDVLVLLGNGDGTFHAEPIISTPTYSVAVGDVNGDGVPDIITAGYKNFGILLGNGNGTFQAPTKAVSAIGGTHQPGFVTLEDVNHDGKLDIVAADQGYNEIAVLLGNGDGTFHTPNHFALGTTNGDIIGEEPQMLAVGDLNHDGNLDVVTADQDGVVTVLLGNGDGTFGTGNNILVTNTQYCYSVAIADLNGDGNPDIITNHNRLETVSYLLGNGNGTFQSTVAIGTGGNGEDVAVADFNRDGLPDIAVATDNTSGNTNGSLDVLINNSSFSASPNITSSAATTFQTGVAGSFDVTTTGPPTAAIMEVGALPLGVTFTDEGNGTAMLTGTPAAGTGGVYDFSIVANNGINPSATQAFVLTVDQAPSISSGNTATFTTGVSGSFTITTTGQPNSTINETGSLPTGVSFHDNGNGTATLFGTPGAGVGGVYDLSLTASNGISPAATQAFTLTIDQPPSINNTVADVTFTAGTLGTLLITTTGIPTSSESVSGTLPSGVTLVDNGNGTADLTGTPATGSGGLYPLVIAASNGVLPNATYSFNLTVDGEPSIISSPSATFIAGSTSTFTVVGLSFPKGNFSEAGSLPTGINFADNGNDTATLSGDTSSVGTFTFVITSSNGTPPDANQTFTLTVVPGPTVQLNSGGTISVVGANTNNTADVAVSNGNVVVTIDGEQQSFVQTSVNAVDITGSSGNDTITIDAGVPAVNINGGGGNDSITANNGAADTVIGGTGNDTVIASGQGSSVTGGQGNDYLIAMASGITIAGGAGNDTIIGFGDDVLNGGAGDDFFLDGGTTGDSVNGGVGLNFAQNNAGDRMSNIFQLIDPPKGASIEAAAVPILSPDTTAVVSNGVLSITGTANADTISIAPNAKGTKLKVSDDGQGIGSFAISSLSGISVGSGAGADVISVAASVTLPATLSGGGGNDSITGGGGDNVLVGGGGSDTLAGGGGTNLLVADKLFTYSDGPAGTGNDSLVGGSGLSIADFSYRTDNLTLSNNGQSTGGEVISSNVSAIWGGTGADTITGTTGGEFLSGVVGADVIASGGAGDIILGGKGEDSVIVVAEPVTLYMKDNANDTVAGAVNQTEDIIISDSGDDIPS